MVALNRENRAQPRPSVNDTRAGQAIQLLRGHTTSAPRAELERVALQLDADSARAVLRLTRLVIPSFGYTR